MVVVGTGVSSKEGRPTGCFTHGKPPFTAPTQSPLPQPWELEKIKKTSKIKAKDIHLDFDTFWGEILDMFDSGYFSHIIGLLRCALKFFTQMTKKILEYNVVFDW